MLVLTMKISLKYIIAAVFLFGLTVAQQQPTHGELLSKGEALLKQAQEVLKQHPTTPEVHAIEQEIVSVRMLLDLISTMEPATQLKRNEESLAQHKKTLQKLLDAVLH